jgi:hypothetical protein
MLKRLIFLLLFLMTIFPVGAQNAGVDYAIRNIRSRFTDGGRQTLVEFEIWNIGGTATVPATTTLRVIASGEEVARDIVQPLRAQEIVTVSLTFATSIFPTDSVQSLRVAVGIDEIEASGSETIQNNFAQISVTIPPTLAGEAETTPEAPGATPAQGDLEGTAANFLRQFGIRLDLANPIQQIVLAVVCIASLILLFIIILVVRLLFRRPPDFGNWQPSYINLVPLDPNSLAGRRQQWQGYAQNNALPPYCSEGSYQVRKLGIDQSNGYLAGWRVDSIRMGQYDRYGRVMRSQILGRKRAVRRLEAAVRKRQSLDLLTLHKRLRPVAKMMVNDFKSKWNERNVMLPIALDVRLRGKYGNVRILFELYQCRGSAWQIIDTWEPEIPITGKPIYEIYTYAVSGQRPGETTRDFRTRLQEDIVAVLAEMIALPPPTTQAATSTNPHLTAVDTNVSS